MYIPQFSFTCLHFIKSNQNNKFQGKKCSSIYQSELLVLSET